MLKEIEKLDFKKYIKVMIVVSYLRTVNGSNGFIRRFVFFFDKG